MIEAEHNSEPYSVRAARALPSDAVAAATPAVNASVKTPRAPASKPTNAKRSHKDDMVEDDDDDDDGDDADAVARNSAAKAQTGSNAAFDAVAVQEHERQFGRPPAGVGRWASCVRILDAVNNQTLALLELTDNECAVSLCTVTFAG